MTNDFYFKVSQALNTTDYDYLDIVADILDRVDDLADDDQIIDAVNDSLIYYKDMWTVLQHFFNPQEANWNLAVEMLLDDLYAAAETLRKEQQQ